MMDSASTHDFDRWFKVLLDAYPREALHVLCGARIGGRAVILDGPAEQPRQRIRPRDKVFVVKHRDGSPTDVYHVEVEFERTDGFQERMVAYWASLALKYHQSEHHIHQVVLWPLGSGCTGKFRRDQAQLNYRSINVARDLDPGLPLGGPLAPLALWSQKPPSDVVERVADRIAETGRGEERLAQIELSLLAEGPLVLQLLKALRRRGMGHILESSKIGRDIAGQNFDRGSEQGFQRGCNIMMEAALRARFGDFDDLGKLAWQLAEHDYKGNVALIIAGATLEDLRS